MKARYGLIGALVILVVAGLWRLRFDADVLNLLPDDLPAVAGLKLYQENFANRREVVITVEGTSAAEVEKAADNLASAIRNDLGANAIWRPPWMDDAKATAEFLAWLWLSQPPEKVKELHARLNPANATAVLNETRERLATSLSPMDLARLGHDPFGVTQLSNGNTTTGQGEELFSNSEGTFRLIFVQPAKEPQGFNEWGAWLESLQDVISKAKLSDLTIGVTGGPVFVVETARGMKGDMRQSVIATLLMVTALFWWAHRRFRPLLWMLVMLVSALLVTMALGGLIFGALNVVSLGFAAILLGLGVDYALVLYQELLGEPHASAREIRAHAAKGIWWSASTTALAFALLNSAGLPGLGQLGTLVAIGIMLAATAMLYGFLPMMTRRPPTVRGPTILTGKNFDPKSAWIASGLILLLGAATLTFAWPTIDHSAQPLGTINSTAERVAKRIDEKMARSGETHWIIVRGRDEEEARQRLERVQEELKAVTNANLRAELPLPLWPRVDWGATNLVLLREVAPLLPKLTAAANEAGFTDEAMDLTASMAKAWTAFGNSPWPSGGAARWLVDRVAARSEREVFAMGLLQASKNADLPTLQTPGAYVASWVRLAEALLEKVQRRMIFLTIGMAMVLVICLRLALKTWIEVGLSFATLAFGFMLTLMAMAALHWKWNLLSLTAIPLLLGAAVDYTIHVQLTLRRYGEDVALMRRTIGRALFLVTAAAVAGFGSLGLASNAGLASFELICAIGMISIFVSALYLLPAWHYTFFKRTNE